MAATKFQCLYIGHFSKKQTNKQKAENIVKEGGSQRTEDPPVGWVICENDGIIPMVKIESGTNESGNNILNKWRGVLVTQYIIRKVQVLYSSFMSLKAVTF